MESLQEEIEGLRKSSLETSEQLEKTKSQLTEKDEDMKSLQADSKRQLIEVYEMKCDKFNAHFLIELLLLYFCYFSYYNCIVSQKTSHFPNFM